MQSQKEAIIADIRGQPKHLFAYKTFDRFARQYPDISIIYKLHFPKNMLALRHFVIYTSELWN
jgi:hypothetical protein